jgi:spore coat protein U-like protein
MRRLSHSLASLLILLGFATGAAAQSSVSISAVVLSKSNCKFDSNAPITLAFGEIDPSSNTNATATATRGFKCMGSAANATFLITAGDGMHASGAGQRRMKHAILNEYMSYSLALSPETDTVARNSAQTLTITGTVTPAQFADVSAGDYSDTVVISLLP